MNISTHVLDTSRGKPAAGVAVTLEQQQGGLWRRTGEGRTDADGRAHALWPSGSSPPPGSYRLCFEVAAYFAGLGVASFYPRVEITFTIVDGSEPHHVPLLLSPFGYSTYRGS
jgi:5-hydroxyisourate hydrolase